MKAELKVKNKFSKRRILTGSDCIEKDHVLEVIDSAGVLVGWIRETGELHFEDRDGALIVLSEA